MSDNITFLNNITTLDVPVDRVIGSAADACLSEVVILGTDSDGAEYFASSRASGPEVLWLLERAKLNLMRVVDSE